MKLPAIQAIIIPLFPRLISFKEEFRIQRQDLVNTTAHFPLVSGTDTSIHKMISFSWFYILNTPYFLCFVS